MVMFTYGLGSFGRLGPQVFGLHLALGVKRHSWATEEFLSSYCNEDSLFAISNNICN